MKHEYFSPDERELNPTAAGRRLYFKGGSSSASAVSDRRLVTGQGSLGVTGDGNSVSLGFSDQTMNAAPGSIAFRTGPMTLGKDASVTVTQTDNGAIGAAMNLASTSTEDMRKTAADALGLAGDGIDIFTRAVNTNTAGALDFADANDARFMAAVGSLSKDAMDYVSSAAGSAQRDVVQAWESAKEMGTGQQYLTAGGLIIAGIVAISIFGKKG